MPRWNQDSNLFFCDSLIFQPPLSALCGLSLSISRLLPFYFVLLPPPLFLASGVPVLLIRPYQWSNLAATAWVSVARHAAPLSCPAVAEINPQIEQSPRWPLQTPEISLCTPHRQRFPRPQAPFLGWGGFGRETANECARVCVSVKECECVGSGWIEWAWDGQGRGIKMADWACLYFQWHFALRGRERKKKCTASKAFKCAFFCLLQTARGGFCEPHSLTFLPSPFNQKYDFFDVAETVCVLVPSTCRWCRWNGSLRTLTKALLNSSSLHCYLSCPSFLGRGPKRSLSGLLLWHTVKRLKRDGWSQVDGGRGSMLCRGRFGAQCNRSALSIVNHCHPSEATLLALNVANPLCSLVQPSVGRTGNLVKRSWS